MRLLLLVAVSLAAQEVVTEPKPRLLPAGPGQPAFDVTRHTLPLDQILGGGVPRDGIPALVDPAFVEPQAISKLLRDADRVLGVALGGAAKAYPVSILNWHELVNDRLDGRPILVTW